MTSAEPTIDWTLAHAVACNGDGEATVDLHTGERRTWSATAQRVSGLASALGTLDVVAGDRVALLMQNSARHFELWFAVPAAGLVLNDLNYRLAVEELRFICEDSGSTVLFVDDAHLDVGRQLVERVSTLRALVWTGPGTTAPEDALAYEELVATSPVPLPVPDAHDVAAIFYTGGTTGRPKGVMLSHRNMTVNALHMLAQGHLSAEDRYLHAGPQFHLADGGLTYSVTWAGGTHVFIPAFEPAQAVTALADERCTLALLVPTMMSMVLAEGGADDADLSALRLVIYGASPMPDALQRRAMEAFGCGFAQAYGMTEASPLATWLGPEVHARGMAGEEPHATRLRSGGAPIPGVEAQVRRPDGSIAATGEAGEVFLRGPNIMAGYWNRPEETAAALVDGWYRTGDVAYADSDGYLYIVDRAKDMIISGGENIYTSEVENAVYSLPGVAEAAVFAIPSEQWGETVHVEVVPIPGATLTDDDVIAHCRTLIARYKVPRSVNVRPADDPLPKSGTGKILKRTLREPFWEGRDARVG